MSLIKKIKQKINGAWQELSLNSDTLDNVVTLNGNQTISGEKSFSDITKINSLIFNKIATEEGLIRDDGTYWNAEFDPEKGGLVFSFSDFFGESAQLTLGCDGLHPASLESYYTFGGEEEFSAQYSANGIYLTKADGTRACYDNYGFSLLDDGLQKNLNFSVSGIRIDPYTGIGDEDDVNLFFPEDPSMGGTIATQQWVEGVIAGKVDYLGVIASEDDIVNIYDTKQYTPGDYGRASADFIINEGMDTQEQVHSGDLIVFKKSRGEAVSHTMELVDIIHTEDPGEYVTLATDQTFAKNVTKTFINGGDDWTSGKLVLSGEYINMVDGDGSSGYGLSIFSNLHVSMTKHFTMSPYGFTLVGDTYESGLVDVTPGYISVSRGNVGLSYQASTDNIIHTYNDELGLQAQATIKVPKESGTIATQEWVLAQGYDSAPAVYTPDSKVENAAIFENINTKLKVGHLYKIIANNKTSGMNDADFRTTFDFIYSGNDTGIVDKIPQVFTYMDPIFDPSNNSINKTFYPNGLIWVEFVTGENGSNNQRLYVKFNLGDRVVVPMALDVELVEVR